MRDHDSPLHGVGILVCADVSKVGTTHHHAGGIICTGCKLSNLHTYLACWVFFTRFQSSINTSPPKESAKVRNLLELLQSEP